MIQNLVLIGFLIVSDSCLILIHLLALRYGVFDFEYTHQCQGTTEASKKEKLFLMSWCPDSAKIKKKMLYSSSFDALKKCLVGVQKYIQVNIIFISSPNQTNISKWI